ncbi:hypothetical protein EYF80_040388 [Liparis tanakae]|uniref:Uncharacterized protein n=1 Tax=Liparis tanakae TaxID=230148 RepID=A0A4Z2G909_9TELE|nr:hypothetical protein EYF80_040388 [Liparis tanakae]
MKMKMRWDEDEMKMKMRWDEDEDEMKMKTVSCGAGPQLQPQVAEVRTWVGGANTKEGRSQTRSNTIHNTAEAPRANTSWGGVATGGRGVATDIRGVATDIRGVAKGRMGVAKGR